VQKMFVQATLFELVAKVREIALMIAAEPAGDVQPALLRTGRLLEQLKRLGQKVQPLFRTNAREIADRERSLPFGARPAVAEEAQTGMNHMNARARDVEIVGHE